MADLSEFQQVEAEPKTQENIAEILKQKEIISKLMQKTWQRRMVIQSLLKTTNETQRAQILKQSSVVKLFGIDQINQGQIVPGSQIDLIFQNQHNPNINLLTERLLWSLAKTENPQISQTVIRALIPQLFAEADNESATIQASNFVRQHGNSNIGEIFETEIISQELAKPGLVLPLTEALLENINTNLTATLGIETLGDPKQAETFIIEWIKKEQRTGNRIVFSPSYQIAAEKIRSYERKNGRNRTISRSIIYGPPGRGKTEFLRTLNREAGKETLVISGRPYLTYEELVASPQLVSESATNQLANLYEIYTKMDSLELVRVILKLARSNSQKFVNDNNQQSSETEKARLFANQWLDYMELPELLKKYTDLNNQQLDSINVREHAELFSNLETIKKAFLSRLAFFAGENGLVKKEEENQKYLTGLLLTADMAGMNVVIDEAEKMLGDNPEKNASFAGLEDVLTRKPGSNIRVGNIEHRFSEDFSIDLTMNIPSLPAHIRSRFGDRNLYFEETAFDRLFIAAVEMADKNTGLPVLSNKAQEQLIVLFTAVWPVLEQLTKITNEPLDLRTLQGILSQLIVDGRSRNITVATALQKLSSLKGISNGLARYPIYEQQLSNSLLNALFENEDNIQEPEEKVANSPLINLLKKQFTDVQYPHNIQAQALSPSEINKLANGSHQKASTAMDSIVSTETLRVVPQIINGSVHQLGIILAGTGDLVTDVPIFKDQDKNEPLVTSDEVSLLEASAYGDIVLIKEGKSIYAVDCFGGRSHEPERSNKLQVARRVSDIVEANPENTHLAPSGNYLCFINQDSGLTIQRLGLGRVVKNQAITYETLDRISLQNSNGHSILSGEFTTDSNYVLVTYSSENDQKSINILDLKKTMTNGITSFIFPEPIPGNNFKLQTFQNILFLYDLETQKGWKIS